MLVRPGCSLRNWDFKVKSGDMFWALFQTDNPNTVGYSHQWCTRVLVYMHPRTSQVICWFWSSLCRIDLQTGFWELLQTQFGCASFVQVEFLSKEDWSDVYMLRLIRSCSNGAGSASRVMCKNIIFHFIVNMFWGLFNKPA
jgi:hypothetical protein